MKIRKIKKGFTIVELVIVIAVIAILSAVLIPTFISLNAKANLSNDQQNVRNMNVALEVQKIEQEGFDYPGDAIDSLYIEGWNIGKLKPYSRNHKYVYSFEKNKMFLLNGSGEVVFPKESVEKSTLWGFYANASEERIDGITKYIAMDNIINQPNLDALIGTSDATIDLHGYYFAVNATYSNLTLVNGILVKGTVSSNSEDVNEYEVQDMTQTTSNTTYTEKVFDNVNGTSVSTKAGTTYENCVFYDSSLRTSGSYAEDTTITFENCSFIGGISGLAAIEIYDNTSHDLTVVIKNCSFIGTYRGINITSTTVSGTNNLTIEGCTFNGVEQAKYAGMQIATTQWNITFKDNTINSLGNAVTIIRFHENYGGFNDISNLDKVTFANNKVSRNIEEQNYIDLDDKFTPADFYQAALAKFKANLR